MYNDVIFWMRRELRKWTKWTGVKVVPEGPKCYLVPSANLVETLEKLKWPEAG